MQSVMAITDQLTSYDMYCANLNPAQAPQLLSVVQAAKKSLADQYAQSPAGERSKRVGDLSKALKKTIVHRAEVSNVTEWPVNAQEKCCVLQKDPKVIKYTGQEIADMLIVLQIDAATSTKITTGLRTLSVARAGMAPLVVKLVPNA